MRGGRVDEAGRRTRAGCLAGN
uniref:Uncharacterized protein n=1 Tax=Arundo donax TaxID=35708 RepID=A0A0A8Y658_ARUDO